MNTFKAEVYKIILGLTSVGLLILLIFPVSLSAGHFRAGTMSWENPWDNRTIRLNMNNGWTADHDWIPNTVGALNSAVCDWEDCAEFTVKVFWGDGDNDTVDFKVLSIDTNTNDTITEVGDNLSLLDNGSIGWKTGVTHTYPDNATTEYIVYWGSGNRATTQNMGAGRWSNTMKVNIGGAYASNISPVSAVPPVVQVQDNISDFMYQLASTDANGDSLGYRWGTKAEFYSTVATNGGWTNATGSFYEPAGMTLSSSGLVTWDVRDSVVDNATLSSLWVAVMMVEDLDSSSGDNKSYIPIDFFFKIASASNDSPSFTDFPTGTQTVTIGSTKTFTIKSTDDNVTHAPTVSVLNPPSPNTSIWDNTTSTSGGETTFTINFAPVSSMDNNTYVVNIRSTDNLGMTKDQSLSLKVSSVANADPTAPILISPANGDNVTSPVTFRFTGSTDSDGDTVSYTMYICGNSGFVGSGLCTGTSVTAGVNFVPPFNQNFHDNLIPWARPLHAATISQQISQDLSMIPKLFIMLGVLGLLSGIISLSVKNITHRRIVFMLFLIIIGTAVSCSTSSDNNLDEENKTSSTSDNTTTDITNTTSDLTSGTTYYWKVVASDPKGGSAQSETWSFTVQ